MSTSSQPVYNFVFDLEQVKTQVNNLAARIGQDIKALRDNTNLGTYKLTGLDVTLTGAVTSTDTIVQAIGRLQKQANDALKTTTLSASSNADSLPGSGLFVISAPATANNFPTEVSGSLTQAVIGSSKTQQYLTNTGLFYVRGYDGSTWSAWRSI